MMSSDWNSEKVYLKNVKEQIEMELFYFFVMKTEYFKKTNVRQSFCRRQTKNCRQFKSCCNTTVSSQPCQLRYQICKCD